MAYTRSRSNSGIGDWYTSSYSNTISRLRTTPFMPGANFEQTTAQLHELEATRSHMSAGSGYQGGVRDRVQVMDVTTGLPMTSRQIAQATDATNQTGANGAGGAGGGAQKKKGQTLFGPDVGFEEADAVGGWTKGDAQATPSTTTASTAAAGTPTVPLNVVKTWIERAKATDVDPNNARVHKTTTLQALVNLKRPSLSLIALTAANPDGQPSLGAAGAATSHALRFNYDASSPAVLVTLSIHPRSYQPYLAQRPVTTLYSARHEGGFGKTWQLPDGHALDLSQLMDEELRVNEQAKRAREEEEERRRRSAAMDGEEEDEDEDLKKGIHRRQSNTGRTAAHPNGQTTTESSQPAAARSRFGMSGIFGRRQRRHDEEQGIVAGIRNAQGGSAAPAGGDVMEMQPTSLAAATGTADPAAAAAGGEEKEKEKDVMEEDGIRLLIRLDALDDQGHKISPSNAQLTHVLLTGTSMTSISAANVNAEVDGEDTTIAPVALQEPVARPSVDGPVKRSWALKVVRREAIIAAHTFLLKEIYGLASASTADAESADMANDASDPYASTPNECIVCLTNARDVVLLPCRHLVVCRECALGMIEFGAGGKVARREDVNPSDAAGTGGTTGAAGSGDVAGDAAPVPAPAPTTRERRKRKAKGWFCPVCRQPYTSLLRLALPAPTNQALEAVDLEEQQADEHADTATIRSFRTTRTARSVAGHSLHRVSSRATLPERGERMLRELAPDADDDDEADDDVVTHGDRPVMRDQQQTQYPPRPQESEGERRERLQQEEMDRESAAYQPAPFVLGNELEVTTPPAARLPADTNVQTTAAGRQSQEGSGWRAIV